MRKKAVKPGASEAWAYRARAADRSKRTKGPPLRTPAASDAKRHEHRAAIRKPNAAGYLPTYYLRTTHVGTLLR
jgi:hypothetical protein